MSIKKNVFIQHTCMFTRNGIRSLLADACSDFKIIADAASLEGKTYRLLYKKDVDIFILGLQVNGDNHGSILDFIMEWLPVHYPQAKVVIMAQTYSIGRIKDYLLGLGNVAAILDNTIKTADLQAHLQRVITETEPQEALLEKKTTVPLTQQEIKVLGHLLKGVPVLKVANILQIDYKTVSRHKRAAMNKLQITSLHSLMRCNINLTMMSNFYDHKKKRPTL